MLKILLLTDGIFPFSVGGMQKHSANLLQELNKQEELDLTLVFTTDGSKQPNFEEGFAHFNRDRLKILYVPFPTSVRFPGHYIFNSWKYSTSIWNQLKEELPEFDFIYAQGFSAWKFLAQSHSRRPPVGLHFHGFEMFQFAAGFKQRLESMLLRPFVKRQLRKADLVYSLGGRLTDILIGQIGVDPNRIVDIPGGVQDHWISQEQATTGVDRRFLFVGRYERRKGIEELTEAIRNLQIPANIKFEFVGPIPVEKQLEHPQVSYLGKITDEKVIKEVFSRADVLVSPSWSEGMPTVIMEAMSRNTAILATDVGANAVLIQGSGKLISPGNANELKRGLEDFMDMEDADLIRMKNAGREHIEAGFTWSIVGAKTWKHLKEYIGRNG